MKKALMDLMPSMHLEELVRRCRERRMAAVADLSAYLPRRMGKAGSSGEEDAKVEDDVRTTGIPGNSVDEAAEKMFKRSCNIGYVKELTTSTLKLLHEVKMWGETILFCAGVAAIVEEISMKARDLCNMSIGAMTSRLNSKAARLAGKRLTSKDGIETVVTGQLQCVVSECEKISPLVGHRLRISGEPRAETGGGDDKADDEAG